MSTATEHPNQETATALAHAPSASTTLFVGGAPGVGRPLETGPVSSWGQWAFDHKQQATHNPLAWYGVRNALSNVMGIFGLMLTIVPVRAGMGRVAQWAEARNMPTLSAAMSHTVFQNSVGVGVSFATFRAVYKICQRAYDRVFTDSQSPQESTRQLHALPGNLWKDFKQVAPAEYPATMTAAFALVGIRSAFTGGPPELKVNHWKDVTGCALFAYPAFFEITEHMGRQLQLKRGYTDIKDNEHINKDQQGLMSFLTRQVPGVAAGILPYIGFNNVAYRYTGRQLSYNTAQRANPNPAFHKIDNYWPAFWKERPYQFFWMYSVGRDLYFDAYDKITGYDYASGTYGHRGSDIKRPGSTAGQHASREVPDTRVVQINEHDHPASTLPTLSKA